MVLYKFASWEHGLWGVRFTEKRYYQLKAPWNEPLFSERNGYVQHKIPLGFGWRILIR